MVEDSGLSVHGHGSLCSVKIFQPGSECLIQKVLVVLAACLFSLDLCRCRPLSPSGRSTHACLWTRLCAGAHAHAAVLLARAVAVPLLGRLWRASPGPDRGVRDGARPVRCTRSSGGGGHRAESVPGASRHSPQRWIPISDLPDLDHARRTRSCSGHRVIPISSDP